MRFKPNIAMLLIFLAVTFSPFLMAWALGQEFTVFDGITAVFLGVFSLTVFIWWKKRKRPNADILDDINEDSVKGVMDEVEDTLD